MEITSDRELELLRKLEALVLAGENLRYHAEMLAEAVTWLLPMAKGYTTANQVGSNTEIVEHAEANLSAYNSRKG